jgi:hypothetical protein
MSNPGVGDRQTIGSAAKRCIQFTKARLIAKQGQHRARGESTDFSGMRARRPAYAIGKSALETSAIAQQMGARAPVFAMAALPAETTSAPPMRCPSVCGLRDFISARPKLKAVVWHVHC